MSQGNCEPATSLVLPLAVACEADLSFEAVSFSYSRKFAKFA